MSIKSLYIIYFITAIVISVATFPDGVEAVFISSILSIPLILIFRSKTENYSEQLLKIFLVALILRYLASSSIYFLEITNFFALDWNVYHWLGGEVADYLTGSAPMTKEIRSRVFSFQGTAWGISLLTGIIYTIVGKNVLAVQLFIAVLGAASAPITYLCTYQIYKNHRAATIAGYIVALMPSLVLWSSIILKDSIIIFFLILAVYTSLKLQEKFSYTTVAVLIFSLIGIMAMRYFVFYMVAVAVVGGFIVGQKNTLNSILTRAAAIVIVGVALGYLGILSNAQFELRQMTALENINISRIGLNRSAASGFGEEYDVSTVGGAIQALPLGFTYLMLSPLPWQVTSTLALTSMPEMIIWWSMLPFLIIGLVYSFRHKLRRCITILIFTTMLTIGYSILQGNIGTAYRQRAQIQVFLFIFIAVGWTLIQERRENEKILKRARKERGLRRLIQKNT